MPARKPAEPVGLSGAMADDMLVELVGQDYGMVRHGDTCHDSGSILFLLKNISDWRYDTTIEGRS